MRALLINGRASHQSIANELGLSSNTVKSRIAKMLEDRVIVRFLTNVKLETFGYDIIYAVVRHGPEQEKEILQKVKLLGETFMVIRCVGGVTVLGIAVKGEPDQKADILKTLLDPAIVTSVFPVQSSPIERFTRTDLLMMKHLIKYPRATAKDIAKAMRVSPRTVKRRLDALTKKEVMRFMIAYDPAAMRGYIQFSMILDIDPKKYQNVVKQIYEELSQNFLLPPPLMYRESAIVVVLYSDNLYTMDEMSKKVMKLDGVRNVDLFLPTRLEFKQEWIVKMIESMLRKNRETTIIHQEDYIALQ